MTAMTNVNLERNFWNITTFENYYFPERARLDFYSHTYSLKNPAQDVWNTGILQ